MVLDNKKVYLLLGSNLGDREHLLLEAVEQISLIVGNVFARSSLYETAAWGNEDQPSFLNLAIGVETVFPPLEVLHKVLAIEQALGRIRHERWGSRLIDIDVILYGEEVIDLGEELQVPHPQMQYRKFVLVPLAEINATYVHPALKKSITALLDELGDELPVLKI